MNLWSANENAAGKILAAHFMTLYDWITNIKLSDWFIFLEKMYSYMKVHVDMTFNPVLSEIRERVVYLNS